MWTYQPYFLHNWSHYYKQPRANSSIQASQARRELGQLSGTLKLDTCLSSLQTQDFPHHNFQTAWHASAWLAACVPEIHRTRLRILRAEDLFLLGLCSGCHLVACSLISCKVNLPNMCMENCLFFSRRRDLQLFWLVTFNQKSVFSKTELFFFFPKEGNYGFCLCKSLKPYDAEHLQLSLCFVIICETRKLMFPRASGQTTGLNWVLRASQSPSACPAEAVVIALPWWCSKMFHICCGSISCFRCGAIDLR